MLESVSNLASTRTVAIGVLLLFKYFANACIDIFFWSLPKILVDGRSSWYTVSSVSSPLSLVNMIAMRCLNRQARELPCPEPFMFCLQSKHVTCCLPSETL